MKYKFFIFLFFLFFCSVLSVSGQNTEPAAESAAAELEKTPISLPVTSKNKTELPKNLFFDTAGKLLIVLGAVYLLFLLLRKLSPDFYTSRFSNRKFGVAASVPLTGKSRLVLVRFGAKFLLLAVSGDRAVKLAETADPQEIDAIIESFSEPNRNK